MSVDTYKHKRWRSEMVNMLRGMGIADKRVLEAIGVVPRHLFLETMLDYKAYDDLALPIRSGQTISKPSTVAYQSQLLDVSPGMRVLEVGTGSGYQTAVLCALGAQVFSVERQKELYDVTKPLLARLGFKATCILGDGYAGLPEFAPFDRVIITCGAPQVPQALLQQLKVGGVMVVPVGDERQVMQRLRKNSDDINDLRMELFGDCSFVPMLQKLNYSTH